jgi:hypothetical protein
VYQRKALSRIVNVPASGSGLAANQSVFSVSFAVVPLYHELLPADG